MAGNGERFENYLREFTPRRPRALPGRSWPATEPELWGRLAAAAVVVITLAASLWLTEHHREQPQIGLTAKKGREANRAPATARLSLSQLNDIALSEPARFDARLQEASRVSLPDFRGEASTLRVLAKE